MKITTQIAITTLLAATNALGNNNRDSCSDIFQMKMNEMFRKSDSSFNESFIRWYESIEEKLETAGSSDVDNLGFEGLKTPYGDYRFNMNEHKTREKFESWYKTLKEHEHLEVSQEEYEEYFSSGLSPAVQKRMTEAWENCMTRGGIKFSTETYDSQENGGSMVILKIEHTGTPETDPRYLYNGYIMNGYSLRDGPASKPFRNLIDRHSNNGKGLRLSGAQIALPVVVIDPSISCTIVVDLADGQGNHKQSLSYVVDPILTDGDFGHNNTIYIEPTKLVTPYASASTADKRLDTKTMKFHGRGMLRFNASTKKIQIRTDFYVEEVNKGLDPYTDQSKRSYYEGNMWHDLTESGELEHLAPNSTMYLVNTWGERKLIHLYGNGDSNNDTVDRFQVFLDRNSFTPTSIVSGKPNIRGLRKGVEAAYLPSNNGIVEKYYWDPVQETFEVHTLPLRIDIVPASE